MYICVMSMFNGLYLTLDLKCKQKRIENAHLLSSCQTTRAVIIMYVYDPSERP